MSYCKKCQANVKKTKKIGVGSILLILITSGLWLVPVIFFYKKRCPICGE